jgi:hypothetical protein
MYEPLGPQFGDTAGTEPMSEEEDGPPLWEGVEVLAEATGIPEDGYDDPAADTARFSEAVRRAQPGDFPQHPQSDGYTMLGYKMGDRPTRADAQGRCRQMMLVFHPDKMGTATDQSRRYVSAVQRAREILAVEPEWRRRLSTL